MYSQQRWTKPLSTPWAAPTRVPTAATSVAFAGSLIWINFDRHALLALFAKAGATIIADKDEIRPQYQSATSGAAVFSSQLVRDLGPQFSVGDTIDKVGRLRITSGIPTIPAYLVNPFVPAFCHFCISLPK